MSTTAAKKHKYPITGIRAGWIDDKPKENPTGAVPIRHEVDDWYPEPKNTKTPEEKEMYLLQHRLFFTALAMFQAMHPYDDKSYFGVAGIHGYPLQPWDGVSYSNDDRDDHAQTTGGYCTHGSILFPTWHRPYLLLFEQRLYEIMNTEIIPNISISTAVGEGDENKLKEAIDTLHGKFQNAADNWRLPYWDWAKRCGDDQSYDLPEIVKPLKVLGIPPKGVSYDLMGHDYKLDNPMYKFKLPVEFESIGKYMQDLRVGDLMDNALVYDTEGELVVSKEVIGNYPFGKCKGTSRWQPYQPFREQEKPTDPKQLVTEEWIEGSSDFEQAKAGLDRLSMGPKGQGYPLAQIVEKLLDPNYLTTYSQFATTKYRKSNVSDRKGWCSLEQVHNFIHMSTGGYDGYMGQMSEVPVAAFDPIFWMHHANCDRLLALWLEIRRHSKEPGTWFDPTTNDIDEKDPVLEEMEGNWMFKKGTKVNNRTGLAPFSKDVEGNAWTSDDAREHKKWGYTYPELQDWLKDYKDEKTGKFDHDLYRAAILRKVSDLYGDSKAEGMVQATKDGISDYEDKVKLEDYIISVQYRKYAIDAPYFIKFYLQPPSTKENPQPQKIEVGTIPSFTNRSAEKCANCVTQKKVEDDGMWSLAEIPLNKVLYDRIDADEDRLQTLKKEDVKKYLADNLSMVIRYNSGIEVPIPKKNPFVEATISVGEITFPALDLEPSEPTEGEGEGKQWLSRGVPESPGYIPATYSEKYDDLGLDLALSLAATFNKVDFVMRESGSNVD